MGGVEDGGCACARAGAVALTRGAPARRPRVWRPPVRRESAPRARARAHSGHSGRRARDRGGGIRKKKKKTHGPKKKKETCARAAPINRRTATVHPSTGECMGFDAFDLDAPIPSKWCISMVSETGCRVGCGAAAKAGG